MSGPVEDSDATYLRGRVHKIADVVQAHEVTLHEQAIEIATMKGTLAALEVTSATSHELESAVALLTLKLEHLHDDLAMIKKAIYWGVGLALSSVIVAVMSLVLRQ
jgi:hypothetical protein